MKNLLKEYIKKLAEEQRALKKARKTGTLPEFFRDGYGYRILPEICIKSYTANTQLQRNKITITAALNLYHEMRGSDYRHSYAGHEWFYGKEIVRINNELVEASRKLEASPPGQISV